MVKSVLCVNSATLKRQKNVGGVQLTLNTANCASTRALTKKCLFLYFYFFFIFFPILKSETKDSNFFYILFCHFKIPCCSTIVCKVNVKPVQAYCHRIDIFILFYLGKCETKTLYTVYIWYNVYQLKNSSENTNFHFFHFCF